MITPEQLDDLIRKALPDADVDAQDYTGTFDHYNLRVVSDAFDGMPLLERHRLIYAALAEALRDGRLHAVQIKTAASRSIGSPHAR